MNATEVLHLRRTFEPTIGVIEGTTREIVAVDDLSLRFRKVRYSDCWDRTEPSRQLPPRCSPRFLFQPGAPSKKDSTSSGRRMSALYDLLGHILFAVFEIVAKRRGILEVF